MDADWEKAREIHEAIAPSLTRKNQIVKDNNFVEKGCESLCKQAKELKNS